MYNNKLSDFAFHNLMKQSKHKPVILKLKKKVNLKDHQGRNEGQELYFPSQTPVI